MKGLYAEGAQRGGIERTNQISSRGVAKPGMASVRGGKVTDRRGRRKFSMTRREACRQMGDGTWRGVCAVGLVVALIGAAPADALSKVYRWRDEVPVVANNVFPYNNLAETYKYYSLPFCKPRGKSGREKQLFGELLVGDRKVSTDYEVLYAQEGSFRTLCKPILEPEELRQFSEAIKESYYYEFFIDDLPVKGPVGIQIGESVPMAELVPVLQVSAVEVHLYTHIAFTIGYNEDENRIVYVKTATHDLGEEPVSVDITNTDEPIEVTFTYSVRWVKDNTPFSERMEKLAGGGLLPGSFEIHWLSIINSFVLVLILTVFLGIILLRGVNKDFSRYTDGEDIEEEESGWKLIHGDVFRFPRHVNLFSALVGAGAHLCMVTLMLLICVLIGVFRPTKRGSILTSILVLYCITASVGGFISARLYRQLGGKSWVWNSVVSSLIFPLPLLGVFSVVNTIALYQSSTAALPLFALVVIVAMFLFIAFPMTVLGAIVGRRVSSDFEAPCRTTRVPRQVPKELVCYRGKACQMFMAGFMPFSAIYIELHYVFASVWGHHYYTLFGILILAFIMLLVVCSFITVALLYFQLGREDHRWWWRSFFSGGSTGLFVYAYSFFYFFNRSDMDGLLQSSFYFGYMAVISYAFFVMLGFVGFMSSLTFVKHIYSSVKCD